MGIARDINKGAGGERESVVDSGAGMHMVSKKELNSAELETVRVSKKSDDGDEGQRRGANKRRSHCACQRIGLIRDSDASGRNTRISFAPEHLCKDHGYIYHWTSGQQPHVHQKGKKIGSKKTNDVSSVVPGLSTISFTSSTPTSSTFSSQDSVICTENPATERSGSTSEESRRNPIHKPTETENRHKSEGREEVQSDLLHDLLDWLQEFLEILVDESSPSEPRGNPAPKDHDTSSSSHELPMESRAKVDPGSGKHSIYAHFPKDPNFGICLKTKITRASCRIRAGTGVPKAENGDFLITADHKVLSQGSESRNNHRCAVVVQDSATQWLQSYPCKTKTSQETQKSLMKFLESTRKLEVMYTDNSLEFGKACQE